ncbi:glycosyltransferase family 2 protein [Tardiphaga sp.]|uniref:glycosyltransferase family 2 protein n=1 Tax=Tardiphaga sp. TaxID=1926292 RepID=UPI0026067015|nr:glycosyltransferase family 2 protein [Tardiphaga sp.]MDB5619756.1 hypothetical protein [Tardiphaga sp.]
MALTQPVLTIAIPTWNRCDYLQQTLEQLRLEMAVVESGRVEILVSDNGSTDQTVAVVGAAQAAGLDIRLILNGENVGSDANIAQCYNLARGDYVLILGDDDLLVDGCLAWLLNVLEPRRHGVVCLRAYGFEDDFRKEFPGEGGDAIGFSDPSAFLAAVNSRMTLISSNVMQKALMPDIDANIYCGSNLVQVHLVIEIALRATSNLYVNAYKIACKRNNSGGYSFSRIFVQEFGNILDQYRAKGLTSDAVREIETRMIIGFLPFYLMRLRIASTADLDQQAAYLRSRFHDRIIFWILLYPVLALPRRLAIGWGAAVTLFGRGLNGDFRRGWRYLSHRLSGAWR